MESINNHKEFEEFLKDVLLSCEIKSVIVNNASFHHNTSFSEAPGIIRHGILTARQRATLMGYNLTEHQIINYYDDDNYVSGLDCVSLSTPNFDYHELYKKPFIYDNRSCTRVDVVIDNSVKAYRNNNNCVNEYLVDGGIPPSLFRAIDIRILNCFNDSAFSNPNITEEEKMKQILSYYDSLKEIAKAVIESELNVPLREMSSKNITLDPHKVIKLPCAKVLAINTPRTKTKNCYKK